MSAEEPIEQPSTPPRQDASAVGRRSKRKGKTYEARVASLLTEFTKVPFRRVPNSGGFNKSGGVVVAEQVFTGDVFCDNPAFRYSVEAKHRQDISLTALLKKPQTASLTSYWHQCLEDAQTHNKLPIMFFKPNISDDWVCLLLTDIERLNIKKIPRLEVLAYHGPMTLRVIERNARGKKLAIVEKQVDLPNYAILDWKELAAAASPELMFK